MNGKLEVKGRRMSEGVVVYGAVGGLVGAWIVMLIGMPVVFIWPEMRAFSWLMFAPLIWTVILFILYFSQEFVSVRFEKDCVTVRRMGAVSQSIPVSELRFFCAVRSQREICLCLTCCSEKDMAAVWEKKLLRGIMTRSSVKLRKKKPDWQGVFAREYLNHLRKNPFGFLRQQGIVMVEMKPEIQNQLLKMYPQLPYRNYTGVNSYYATRDGYSRDGRAVVLMDYQRRLDCDAAMEPEGIYLKPRKGEERLVPAQTIKTVLRVDALLRWSNYGPAHLPLVLVSSLSEEELIYHAPRCVWDNIDPADSDRKALLAMAGATHLAMRVAPPDEICTVMHFTENNIQKLRELYPHAQFNDISACWLENSDGTAA